MFTLAAPAAADAGAVEALLDACFGSGRRAKASYRYRDGVAPVDGLGFVAREDARLVGSIAFWPVAVGAAPALLLGPLGIAPDRRGRGIGRRLVEAGLGAAAARGHGVVLLVGGVGYYGRFGFVPAAPHGIVMAGEPTRLLVRELAAGALARCRGPVRPWRGLRCRIRGSGAVARGGTGGRFALQARGQPDGRAHAGRAGRAGRAGTRRAASAAAA